MATTDTSYDREDLVATLKAALLRRGLDLIQPFALDAYNCAVEPCYRVPDFGRGAALALLVGNTSAIWPEFLSWLRRAPERLERPSPLNAFVVEVVEAALQERRGQHR